MKKILTALLLVGALVGCNNQTDSTKEKVNEHVNHESNQKVESKEQAQETVSVTISKDNGKEVVATKEVEVKEGQTVMEVMQANFKIETAYEGAFVDSIDGVKSDAEKKLSWFYYVNDKEATVGANEYKLKAGDKVKFDYHSWE